jgi:hypothetical protein
MDWDAGAIGSTRVGAAQDLAELDIDLAAIRRPVVGSRRVCPCNMLTRSMPPDPELRGQRKGRGGTRLLIERVYSIYGPGIDRLIIPTKGDES